MLKYSLIFLLLFSCTKIIKEEITPTLVYEVGVEVKTNEVFNGKPIYAFLTKVENITQYTLSAPIINGRLN